MSLTDKTVLDSNPELVSAACGFDATGWFSNCV